MTLGGGIRNQQSQFDLPSGRPILLSQRHQVATLPNFDDVKHCLFKFLFPIYFCLPLKIERRRPVRIVQSARRALALFCLHGRTPVCACP